MTPEEKAKYDEEQKKERIIARSMNEEKVQDQKCFKLLLLGTGESGKSTLFKQMLQIYGKGISQEELQALLPTIHANLYIGMVALCQNCEQWAQVAPENQDAFRYFQSQNVAPDTNVWNLDALQFQFIKQLWSDPAIQTAWSHRSEYQIYDSTEYFMNKIGQIEQGKDYQVNQDDYLRLRVRTTGIVESDFVIDQNQFRLHDVGGQRNERKKWIHCFENVTAVIFVAAMSEYDQRLLEDETTNRLQETLDLFADICNSKWFTKTAMLLFLN
jgi:GTPase SAR1 family protein